MQPPSKQQIEDAHERIAAFVHQTPIFTSNSLNEISGCNLFFKCENFQKVGAFKMRGATNTILQLSDKEKSNGIVTHSSGNHAQAVAKAASYAGCVAYIVMPNNAPKVKISAVEQYGGKITFCPPTLIDRETTVENIIKTTNATFIHPYNDERIITGQATAAKELIEQAPGLDAIVCPVGGGGLLAGTILSARYFGNNINVYAGEPEGAKDAFLSIKQAKLIPQLNPNTIADGLLTSLGKLNFEIIKKGVKEIQLVNDKEIIGAMRLIWERLKIVVEPSAAVPLAAIIKNKNSFKNKSIGIILSGGNVDLDHYFDSLG